MKITIPLLTLGFALNVLGAENPPKIFIDKGACPFECCTYQEWIVRKDTEILDAIDGKKTVGTAKKGSKIQALTGEVHTVPLKARTRNGEEVYLLTYQGEGYWKVWRNGKMVPDVEGDWSQRPDSTWWIQIRLPDGKKGWSKQPENFGNKDACG